MKKYAWVFDPHSDDDSVPATLRAETRVRILKASSDLKFTEKNRFDVRFRGSFCYVDAFEQDDPNPTRLLRLRYSVAAKKWSVAFFTYSNDQYTPCMFPSGAFLGNPEDAMPLARLYL